MAMFKSLESIDITKQTVKERELSVQMYNKIKRAIVCQITRDIAYYLYSTGDNSETLTKKLTAIYNAFASGGEDIANKVANEVRWIVASVTGSHDDVSIPVCASLLASDPWYITNCMYDLERDDISGCTDVEKSMMAEFSEAKRRYDEIHRKIADYVGKACEQISRDLIVKYSSSIEQVAPEWLKQVSSALRLGLPIESKQLG